MINEEKDTQKFNFRTDLASERRDLYKKANSIEDEISGIESTKEEINDKIAVERVKITNEEGEKAIGKPKGNYITIDIKQLKLAQDDEIRESFRSFNKGTKRGNRKTCG